MSDKIVEKIPYYIAEAMVERQAAITRRVWWLCFFLIVLLVMTNGMWLWYESQFSYYEESVEQDIDTGDGDTTVIGIGDNYGKSTPNNNEER